MDGLLTLSVASIPSDRDGASQMVWMTKRMIKQARQANEGWRRCPTASFAAGEFGVAERGCDVAKACRSEILHRQTDVQCTRDRERHRLAGIAVRLDGLALAGVSGGLDQGDVVAALKD
jgi:hypothetical protein